ncbi:MAG: hypothetical protein KHY89_00280 [Butyricicoccus pullicaecorum]|nr:hypothetical protein [Butyricicoccus pullicaecorum]
MNVKKRMMLLGMAAIVSVSLLGGCGKDYKEPDSEQEKIDAAQLQEAEAQKPSLNDPEQIAELEETLAADFDSVEQVEIVQEESGYRITLTLKSSESINDELKDAIISKIVQNYADLTEDQIVIELAE